MPSDLQITNIRDQANANSAITIGSDGQITVNQNNPTITLGSNASMASSGLTVRNITQVSLGSDQTLVTSTTKTTFFSPTYNPKFSGSKVQGWLTIVVSCNASIGEDGRKDLDLEFTGSDITPITWGLTESNTIGTVGRTTVFPTTIIGPLITTTGTGTITCNCKLANMVSDSSIYWYVYGDGTARETTMTWVEYK
jgi:hypothetical protein